MSPRVDRSFQTDARAKPARPEGGIASDAAGSNNSVVTRRPDPATGVEPERGFIVAVLAPGVDESDELAELRELSRAAGVEPVGELVQRRARPDERSYVGKGKLKELQAEYKQAAAESLLVDDELSPAQQRRLEDALTARVVDRTQLILDIFAQHARSAEGKLQVELAQLEYNLPRMRGMWQHLERLGGGLGVVGGGVGTRGPGESQLETDRRLAGRRITLLRRRLRELGKQRAMRRRERRRSETPTVALAGYTNVGKSTLLNRLTDAGASVDDRLFETLDPTTRAFEHQGRRYLVTDTVGFIRRLPHQLVEGFAATLEETLTADLVLHVVDASASEEQLEVMTAAVESVLHEIGADKLPVLVVVNKIDAVDQLTRRRLANRFPGAPLISARTGEGLEELRATIADRFADRFETVRLLLPYEEGAKLAELYALGAPIDERTDGEDGVLIRARLPRRDLRRFASFLIAEATAEPEQHRATR
jgi:GTPase